MDVARTLERTQWDFFWIPPDARVIARDQLLLVACPRDIPHLNTATRIAGRSSELPTLLETVRRAHQGVRSRVMVVEHGASPELEAALGNAGYRPENRHLACAVSVESYARTPPSDIAVRRVEDLEGLRDWHRVATAAFGEPREVAAEDAARELEACTGPAARVQRYVAYDEGGEPLSSGGLTSFPSLGFGLLWAGGTVPHARGRGAYTSVVAARMHGARRAGLSHVGLYARVETSAPIVKRQGFVAHGEMVFWSRPPEQKRRF